MILASGRKLFSTVERRIDRGVVAAEHDASAGDGLRQRAGRETWELELVPRAERGQLERQDLELLAGEVIPVEPLVLGGKPLLDVGEVLLGERPGRKLERELPVLADVPQIDRAADERRLREAFCEELVARLDARASRRSR